MKNRVLIAIVLVLVLISVSSCKKLTNITDSDISAIRDQTEVLKEHNELIKQQNEILLKIEKKIK